MIIGLQVEFQCIPEKTRFFWRKPLLRQPCAASPVPYQCKVFAPPQPPSALEFVQVDEVSYFPLEDTVHVALSWGLPLYSNGELKHHQLRVGSVPIPAQQDTLEAGIIFKLTEIKVLNRMY